MRQPSLAATSWSTDLLVVLTQKEIKVRYKSSWLGYAWSVANPLAFALVYFMAFGVFMRVQIPGYPYPLFLVVGLFPWQWVANSINMAPSTFVANATLIKRVRFPRAALVASSVLNDGLHFLVSLPVIVVLLLAYGFTPSWTWLAGVPLLVVAQFMLIYGIALIVASLNLFFRDLERLTAIATSFLFFMTPIIYPFDNIPPRYQPLLRLNPLSSIIGAWQELFLAGTLDLGAVAIGYAWGAVFLVLGWLVYRALSPRFAELV
jgi:lipopolysaccharide transport system permease protein